MRASISVDAKTYNARRHMPIKLPTRVLKQQVSKFCAQIWRMGSVTTVDIHAVGLTFTECRKVVCTVRVARHILFDGYTPVEFAFKNIALVHEH